MLKNWQIILFFVSTVCLLSFGSLEGEEALWMRYPAISPDGQTIVFSYQGNLFRVKSGGGRATPLTMHPAYDFYPVWSNDGQNIAFNSNKYGNFDVFLINKDGGAPKRLTFHSTDDVAYCFTPDSMSVLFGSARLDHPQNMQFPTGSLPELYSGSVMGGRPDQILTTPALHVILSSKGSRMLFEDTKGFEDPFRKHHTSSITRDIWLYEKEGEMILNENAERDYLYDHVTRQVKKKFYDPGLHGAQWEMLQNGVIFGIPNLGVADKSGDILENKQLEPDILVKNEYSKVANGVDQQLERAVGELLEDIEKK